MKATASYFAPGEWIVPNAAIVSASSLNTDNEKEGFWSYLRRHGGAGEESLPIVWSAGPYETRAEASEAAFNEGKRRGLNLEVSG